ncbi:hypothetical protein LMG24238_05987 [Paraburkholderia sediminicola]|uniref:Uncharacterized protein n=1 Tax=Paraburkholderia sediminicola TaxID=458836 RepID=A0A6J5CCQ1_9BURK|nr:hypothetical protein LMG24238_05987 [Paraburkholderia sediminicola]
MPDERRTSVLSLSYAASPCDANQLNLGRIAEASVISNGSSEAEPPLTRFIHLVRFLLHSNA